MWPPTQKTQQTVHICSVLALLGRYLKPLYNECWFDSAVRPKGHANPIDLGSSSWLPASSVCPCIWSHSTLHQFHSSSLKWDCVQEMLSRRHQDQAGGVSVAFRCSAFSFSRLQGKTLGSERRHYKSSSHLGQGLETKHPSSQGSNHHL